MQALQTLLQRKAVDYDFQYYKLPQLADVAVTILSVAGSLLKDEVDVSLPLKPTAPIGVKPHPVPPGAALTTA